MFAHNLVANYNLEYSDSLDRSVFHFQTRAKPHPPVLPWGGPWQLGGDFSFNGEYRGLPPPTISNG